MAKYILSAFADEAAIDLPGQIAALKQNGITHIELRLLDGRPHIEKTDDELKAVKAQLDEAGIKVSSIGSPIGKYEIEKDFEPHFAQLRRSVEIAKLMGADKIRIFSFFIKDGKFAEYKDEVIDRLQKMVAYAKAEGITLCHENEEGIYGDSPERVAELLEAVPDMGAIWDAANYILCGFNPMTGFNACKSRLTYMHIKDALGLEEAIVPAGEGEGLIKEVMELAGDATEETIFLTMEPHLALFNGRGAFDTHGNMATGHDFKDEKEAFAYGVSAFRKVLKAAGYEEKETGVFTPMALKKIRFGILGVGVQGSFYTDLLVKGKVRHGVLGAVADTSDKAIEKWHEKFGDPCPVYKSMDELMSSGEIDCIMIEIPHYQHPDMVIKCLKAGIPVIVDKPAGVYTKQVEEMNAVAKETGVPFGIMFNQRQNPLFRKMKSMIERAELGQIKRASWIITSWYRNQAYYDSGAWRGTWDGEGGGVLYNQAPHQLDLFPWILGMMPEKIHAFCHFGKWHKIDVEDDVTAYMEFPNGATGTFITTTADFPGTNRLEIVGTKGTLLFDEGKLTFFKNNEDEREFCFSAPESTTQNHAKKMAVPIYGENIGHAWIMNNYASYLLGIEPLFAEGPQGINGVTLANAMHLSSFENRTVSLPIDGDAFLSHLEKKVEEHKKK